MRSFLVTKRADSAADNVHTRGDRTAAPGRTEGGRTVAMDRNCGQTEFIAASPRIYRIS